MSELRRMRRASTPRRRRAGLHGRDKVRVRGGDLERVVAAVPEERLASATSVSPRQASRASQTISVRSRRGAHGVRRFPARHLVERLGRFPQRPGTVRSPRHVLAQGLERGQRRFPRQDGLEHGELAVRVGPFVRLEVAGRADRGELGRGARRADASARMARASRGGADTRPDDMVDIELGGSLPSW